MPQTQFYVDKTTHTFSDALTAFGLATLLETIVSHAGNRADVRMEDQGSYYRLSYNPGIDADGLARFASTPLILAPVVRTFKNRGKLPDDLPPQGIVDYEEVRDHRTQYWEARKNLPLEARKALARGEQDHPALLGMPGAPDPDWDIYRALNPAGLIGYNSLMAQWWESRAILPQLLDLLFRMTSATPNDVAAAEDEWKKLAKAERLTGSAQATAGQLYNPAQGKGQNRAKADSLSMGNVKTFWLLEFLKAVGFYRAGFTRLLKGTKDRKTYVVAPRDIRMESHHKIIGSFKGKMLYSESATKSDVLAALRYTIAFLDYCQENEAQDLLTQLMGGGSPRDAVRGFYVAFYKNLGNSAATLNLSFINTPGWIRLSETEDVIVYRSILAEHETIIGPLDESHSDAAELLSEYRDFIASDNLTPFFRFSTSYSSYLIGQKERGKYAPQFTIENLRRLFMSAEPKLAVILDPELHPGFQSIAYAIRQSTVVAQYRKKEGDRRYDVRYGLGQELARKSRYSAEFIATLSDFLHKYNAENAQVMENRGGPYRKSLKTSDIDDIVALVDEYGSELICNLLIAYGYARSGKGQEESQPSQDSGDLTEVDSGDDEDGEDGDE
jgi:hypothetical protein